MKLKFITKPLRQLQTFVRRNKCKHTHIFIINLPHENWYSLQPDGKYKNMGKHEQLQLRGCYICGKVWAHDYGA